MTGFDSTSQHDDNSGFEPLLKQSSSFAQMRNPLNTLWNSKLTDQPADDNQQLLSLIDFSQMNSLFENFLLTIGLPVAIIDLHGAVLASSKWQRLCVDFYRANPHSLAACIACDKEICGQLHAGQDYALQRCSNGLIDCAAPIKVEGQHIANLFIGQFFIESPDWHFFELQQQKFGFDKSDYFAAITEVPVVDAAKLPALMALLVGWAQQIAAISLAEKRAINALANVELLVKQRTDELRQSHDELLRYFNQPFIGMLTANYQKKTLNVNQRFCDMVGYSAEEMQTIDWGKITHPDDLAPNQVYMDQAVRGEIDFYQMEKRYLHKDGHIVYVDLAVNCIRDAQGKPDYFIGMMLDITERKQAEQALRDQQAMLQTAQHAARLGHYVTDLRSGTWTNDELFDEIFGIDETFTRDFAHWHCIIHPDDVQRVMDYFQYAAASREPFPSIEYRIIRPRDGEIRWIGAWGHDFYDADGTAIQQVGMIQDITDRKLTEERIHHLAFYDPLTELPNRRLLLERIKHGIDIYPRLEQKMAILMLDLDKFKAVNDNFGHTAGDELLQQVAQRIKSQVRQSDTVVRLGGDEFVVLLEGVRYDEYVSRIANDIITALSQPFSLREQHEAHIGTSIGISIYPQHGDSVDALMDNADAALYHAKDNGRGCFAYFSEELTEKARARIALETRLRRAIEQQELEVFFQPQIAIDSGKISGAEALVRWHDPVEGYLMPSAFIALAEETGLIIPLGEWVLRETCRLGKQWLDNGLPPITLAVNVSSYQFRHCDINQLVTEVLAETGFPAHYLELEITESGLMDNQKQALTILKKLHDQGIVLAIDDFGTGYSSLAYLKYFPVDVLKIDKSFIDDIPFLQNDMAITATIIAMADRLGFKVLAEGVETYEQLVFLQLHGCDYYQGYLYSKPIAVKDFVELLISRHTH